MISQTLNQRKSKKSVVTQGPKQSSLFSFVRKLLCSGMKAIKKPDMQLYISGLINQLLKQVMPLYESTLLLSYSPNNDLF